MQQSFIGYQVRSTSGIIGDSTKPIALFGYTFKSGGTAGVIQFLNGSTSGGTLIFDDTGTINVTKVVSVSDQGIVFPAGLYVSIDGNVSTCTIFYRQVQS